MTTIAVGARLRPALLYLLLVTLAGAVWWRRSRVPIGLRTPRPTSAAILLGLTAVVVALIAAGAARDRLSWDGWAIWTFKARVLFLEKTLPGSYLAPTGGYEFSHPDYPLALPLVGWWVYEHAGLVAPRLASLIGAVWFGLLPLLMWSALRERIDVRIAATAALGTAAFWPLAFFAVGGAADVLIAVGLLGGLIELERSLAANTDHPARWRAAVFFSLAALAKNEGLALAIIVLLVGTGALLRAGTRRWRAYLPLALPLLAATPWFLFTRLRGLGAATLESSAGIGGVWERIPLFFYGLGTLFSLGAWMPVLLLAGLGLLASARQRSPSVGAAGLILAGYFAVVCAVYLQAPYDLLWIMATSLHRVLATLVPSVIFLALLSAVPLQNQAPVREQDWRIP
jgi:hypothetical protein